MYVFMQEFGHISLWLSWTICDTMGRSSSIIHTDTTALDSQPQVQECSAHNALCGILFVRGWYMYLSVY